MALDADPEKARSWIERANPTHPSLVDSRHQIDELLGINNVPMAVWIDETGTLVRPAESASIETDSFRSIEITEDMPERMQVAIGEIQKMPHGPVEYRAAIVDWVANGAASQFAWDPDMVIQRSQSRPEEHARAAACFELGQHLLETRGKEAAKPWWVQAHALFPGNWTYKRQAWTLDSTPEGGPSDLSQEVSDTYGTTWLDDVLANGGGANYGIAPQL